MKQQIIFRPLIVLLVFAVVAAQAQSESARVEAAALEKQLLDQRQRLREQRLGIEALKAELLVQQQQLKNWMASKGLMGATVATSSLSSANQSLPANTVASSKAAPFKPAALNAQTGIRIPIQVGQEIPTAAGASPSLKLGPADVRIQGYVGLSGIFRSASMGGGPGTSFASVPLSNAAPANITEFRVTTQTSRIAVRVDVPLRKDRLAGYMEADFSGATPGDAVVTSSSYGFRVRHAWIDYRSNKLEFAAGQMFSLITPSRSDIQTWPADANTTQAVDTNYVAGLVWDRAPAVRLVYRPNRAWNFAVAIENPEQQVGSFVRFPMALNDVLSNQYNTGRGELRTPNPAPDTILKTAWNRNSTKHNVHVDFGLLFRFFRNYDPLDIREHQTALGIGGNLNLSYDLTRKMRLVGQGYLSSGGGRYIGGIVPDVVVRPDGQISPIKAHSWVTGLELAVKRRIGLFVYYSGAYAGRNTTIDPSNGQFAGFGFPSTNNARRSIQEWTGGWSQALWSGEDAGSVQYSAQYSWLGNNLWASGNAADLTNASMVFVQLRYNLP